MPRVACSASMLQNSTMEQMMRACACMQTPYVGMSEEQIIQRKVHAEVDMESPATAPAEIAHLIQTCLNRQSFQRPSFNNIKSSLHTLLATYWSVE